MREPYRPLFDAQEAARYARESQEQLARFRSQVMVAIESIQATIVASKKLIVAAKAIRDKPM
jgi:hypothetical protein